MKTIKLLISSIFFVIFVIYSNSQNRVLNIYNNGNIIYSCNITEIDSVKVEFTSTNDNDNNENPEIGEYVPTAYWEVGSTACKAGETFSFSGKYWTEDGYTPDHSEVWYSVVRSQESSASLKLAGTLMSYTKAVAEEDTVRTSQSIASFPHADAVWDGYEFVITGTVPTSRALAPLKWAPKVWDEVAEERFNSYFPAGFADEFKEEVLKQIVQDANYSALRKVFCDYPFTNEQVTAVNAAFSVNLPLLPDTIISKPDAAVAAGTYKSDLWYTTTEDSNDAVVGYYYITIAEDGSSVINEITAEEIVKDNSGNLVYTGDTTKRAYKRYASAEWVLCRYDDDQGAIVSTVRAEYIPAFAKLLECIPFEAWINDNTEGYAISFNRSYFLDAEFRVYDTFGNVGKAYDKYKININ